MHPVRRIRTHSLHTKLHSPPEHRESSGRCTICSSKTRPNSVAPIALRLLNLMFSLAKGEAVTAPGMQNLIERADANKLERARERLEAGRNGHRKSGAAADAGTTQR